jgi:hypothetical protein
VDLPTRMYQGFIEEDLQKIYRGYLRIYREDVSTRIYRSVIQELSRRSRSYRGVQEVIEEFEEFSKMYRGDIRGLMQVSSMCPMLSAFIEELSTKIYRRVIEDV